jgi:hypothetical protein
MAAAKKPRKVPAPRPEPDPLEPLRAEHEATEKAAEAQRDRERVSDELMPRVLRVGLGCKVELVCRGYRGATYVLALSEEHPDRATAEEHMERIRAAIEWDWRRP